MKREQEIGTWRIGDDESPWTEGDAQIALDAGGQLGAVHILFPIENAEGERMCLVEWEPVASDEEQEAIRQRASNIVRAVNNFESLVEAMRETKRTLKALLTCDHCAACAYCNSHDLVRAEIAAIDAALALAERGEDAKFRFKVGQRVYWTDPENLTSGYGVIETINGEDDPDADEDTVIALKMDDGGEVEAVPHELTDADAFDRETEELNSYEYRNEQEAERMGK